MFLPKLGFLFSFLFGDDDITDLTGDMCSDPASDPASDDPPRLKIAAIQTPNCERSVSYDVDWDGVEAAPDPSLAAVKFLKLYTPRDRWSTPPGGEPCGGVKTQSASSTVRAS